MNPIDWISAGGLLGDFHFLRPVWLTGIPVALLLGLLIVRQRGSTRWEDLIPSHMLEALRVTGGRSTNLWKWLIPLCLIVASIAASGPTWKKIPIPTAKAQSARVILLDLSPSMLATDIAPDRLTRVKYKLIDILRASEDGQTALIAYSGTPHRVAPLTDDARTIEALLPALHPTMMPAQGSDTETAIDLAIEMLQASGAATGDILLITDGVAPDAQRTINDRLGSQYRLSILGVGSTEAVPIPKLGGGFVSDARGEIVLTELNRNELQILAGRHRGRYVEIQTDDSDIRYLMQNQDVRADQSEQNLETIYDSWEDVGYYLLLLLLPVAAYSFRRGLIFCLPLVLWPSLVGLSLLGLPQETQALEWEDLWKTPDQQAAEALEKGDTTTAAEKFETSDWSSYALYRDGEYASSAEKLVDQATAEAHYNRGNALALNGELEEAIESYDAALALNPDMEDAQYNKELVEQLLDQQEQQQSESDQSESSEQSEDSDQSENSENASESEQNQSDTQDSQEQQNPSESEEENQGNPEEQDQPTEESEQEEQENTETSPSPEESEEQSEETQAELAEAEETPEQMDPASEQWLRAIPDDPSGLLRRKFQYESEVYRREQRFLRAPPGTEEEERY